MIRGLFSSKILKGFALLALIAGLGALPLVLAGCDSGTDEDGPDSDCTVEDGLEVTNVTPSSGFNLEEHEVTLLGGCFEGGTEAVLVDDEGSEMDLAEAVESQDEMIVTIPAGIPVGPYTIRLARGDLTADGDYDAVSDIVVASGIEWKFYVVDVSDIDNPREVLQSEPLDADLGPPVVDATGTKVFYSYPTSESEYGIFRADLLGGDNILRITPDDPPLWGYPDASPTGDLVTMMGCDEVGNVCDVYVIAGGGGIATKVADHDDVLIVNGDETQSWNYSQPVFSPNGTRIAFLSDSVNGTGDHYDVIVVMDSDGSDKVVAYWETGGRFYEWLNWTYDDHLIWCRRDSDVSPQEIWMLEVGETAAVQVTPPVGGFGDFVWLVYSPLEPGFILQPAYTAEMVYYPLTFGVGITAGAGLPVQVPDPDNPGGYFAHYSTTEWFGWSD